MNKVKVGIIGATGYAGAELLRILYNHKFVEISGISSVSFEGKNLNEVYPNFYHIIEEKLTDEDKVIEGSDVVFASLPHGLSEAISKKCIEKDVKVIDLGADFRLSDEEDYKYWYGKDYLHKELHALSVYSIPELHRNEIGEGRKIIANPGCYPTSIALGLAPLLVNRLAETENIIIDSKSGVTGAGRSLSQSSHYPECNENFSAYKVASHRHTPEIEETLSKLAKEKITVTFVPHLLPVNRGILSTIYVKYKGINIDEIYDIYNEFYKNEKFVRVLEKGNTACIRNVKFSNYCDISLHIDKRTDRIIVVSCIDNMVKGAAGQAIQNMNILFGFKEEEGLDVIAPAF